MPQVRRLNSTLTELFTRWKELKGVKEFTTNEQYFKWLNEVAEHYRLDYFFDDIVLMPYPVHTDEDSQHSKIIEDLCGAELYKDWKELRHEMKFATEVQYVEWLMDVGNHYILLTPRGRSCSDEEEETWLSKVTTLENEIDNTWETLEDRENASAVCKEQSPKVTNEHAPVVKEETTLLSKQEYMSCKVCGDKAARVKYGALTCAGCEMFFYRNRPFNLNTFTCVNQEKCVVNVEQKKACTFCRLKKCLSVGMRPGGANKEAKIKVKKFKIKGRKSKVNSSKVNSKGANKEAKIKVKKVKIKEEKSEMNSKELCKVCGDKAAQVAYGVLTCRGCQTFYYRKRWFNLTKFTCVNNQNCVVNVEQKKSCAYCRFKKCISVGMRGVDTGVTCVVRGSGRSLVLLRHKQAIHNLDYKPYRCKVCDKRFTCSSYLVLHRKIHDMEKAYECPLCIRGLRKHNNLKAHMIIHTGIKPHICPTCSKSFARKGNMKRHYQNMHSEGSTK